MPMRIEVKRPRENLLPLWEKVPAKRADEGDAKRQAANHKPDTRPLARSLAPLTRRFAERNDTLSHKGRGLARGG
jgi:hypothetical protein